MEVQHFIVQQKNCVLSDHPTDKLTEDTIKNL